LTISNANVASNLSQTLHDQFAHSFMPVPTLIQGIVYKIYLNRFRA